MKSLLYPALCLALPALWGLLIVALDGLFERVRKRRAAPPAPQAPEGAWDYEFFI